MKKILIFVITTLLVLVQAETWTIALAASNIPLECSVNQYSVDRITAKDKFTKLGCFNENQFQEAYDFMLSQAAITPNVVIRHSASYSPMKIVAADRAMAYSQNNTYLKVSTMNIHRDKALTNAYSYMNQSNPLYYYKTEIKSKSSSESVKPSDLSVEIEVNGARGYVELNGIDIIPLIYVENRANNWYISFTTRNSLDNTYTGNIIRPNITQYIVYDVTNNTKNGSKSFKQIKIQVDTALYSNQYDYGLAPSWLPNGTYYSPNGVEFFTDMDLKNPVMNGDQVGRYYNYYDYLNLRTKTNYTGAELDEYFMYFASLNPTYSNIDIKTSVLYPRNLDSSVREIGSLFVNAQNMYGMNALMIYAMALHESGYGTSGYARTRNNLFGWGAYDSNPDNAYTFPNIAQGINEHMGINLRYYLDATNTSTSLSRFYSSNIGNKGAGINTRYASDPWWSIKIAGIAFRIDRYLGLKDFDNYQLSILNEDTRTLYKDKTLTTTAYSIDARATNYPIVISASHNDTYYTQSTNPIVGGNIVTNSTTGLVVYDWENSKVYLGKTQTSLVNTPKTTVPVISDTDELLLYVTNLEWREEKIYIKGWAALKSSNMALDTTHKLKIINMDDSTETILDLSIATENYELNLGNGLDYSNAWYEGTIDVSTLADGNYRFEVVTKSGDTSGVASFNNTTVSAPRAELFVKDNIAYRFSFNNTRGMRYELSKETNLFVENQIPLLPTRFNSTAYITNFLIEENDLGEDLLTISGVAYIQNVATGLENNVSHKLLLLNLAGVQTIIDLSSGTGVYDVSNSGFDYSNAWFYGNQLNLKDLPNDTYRMFIITSSSDILDVVEVRDILIKNTQTFTSTDKNYSLDTNTNVRRRYQLTISDKVVDE